jgi:hypothetical protein
MIENKYESLSTVVSRSIADVNYLTLTTDIATVMNSTKSFIVLTGHYLGEYECTNMTYLFNVS